MSPALPVRILLAWIMLIAAMLAAAPPGRRILVHGHRGARAMRPENTLPAFEYAIAAGVDALEMDLQVTRDDVLVVSHDPTMNPDFCEGPSGTRVIREMTLAELRRWDCGARQNPRFPKQIAVPGTRVPTLDEALALASKGRFDFNIETKMDGPRYTPTPERFAELLLAAIHKHRLESRVIVQSFDFRTLRAMHKLAPQIRLSALDETGGRGFVEIARDAGSTIVSPHFRFVTPEQVKAAHAAGIQVVPWTAKTPAEWGQLITAGADAIITDDPAALIAYLKRR